MNFALIDPCDCVRRKPQVTSRRSAELIRALRWGDGVALTLALVLVGAAFWMTYLPKGPVTELIVHQADQTPIRFALDQSRVIRIEGVAGITEIEISHGRARCLRSPGSQGICERSGWLEQPGDIAVSLPNRLLLRVEDGNRTFDSLHF